MRISVLACILSGVAAFCVYACVAHIVAARNQWFRSLHLIFAALALMVAVHALAHIGMYSSTEVARYVAASYFSNLSGAFAMGLVPWIVHGYFAAGSRVAPAIMSVFYVLSALTYLFAAFGSAPQPVWLDQVTLPWGELATINRLPVLPLALMIFWAGNLPFLIYLAVVCARRRQRGRLQVLAMIASIGMLMLAIGCNMLIVSNRLDSIFLGEFGFLGLVFTMMHLLSGEQSYRAIIAQASAGIFVLSASHRFIDANRMACAMLGRSRAELLDLSISDIVVSGREIPRELHISDPEHAPYRAVKQLRRRDGSTVLIDMSAQVLSDGRELYIARDVTESRRADSAIRLLAETAPAEDVAAFVARCAWSLADAFGVRHAAIGVLDQRRERVQVLGRWPVLPVSGQQSYPLASSPCVRLTSAHRSVYLADAEEEFPAHLPFIGSKVAGYLGTAIFERSGAVVGVLEIWHEQPFVAGAESLQIMEMFAHRIAAELERSAAYGELRHLTASLEARIDARTSELAQANQELEAFSYSVSHDLRAPVRAIDAHAKMLEDESSEAFDPGARKHLDRILQAARRMRELIDGLLTLARVSHQHQTIETVDLSELATQAIELLQEREPARRVEFVCEQGVSARADRTGVAIILTNLVENAWKYSSCAPVARIEFGSEKHAGEVVYVVRDNGVGFDMQHAKHLFEPFRRLHSVDEYPGSGIGLATVARIVLRHGGRVWTRSAIGQGATFYFTLQPLAQALASQRAAHAAAAHARDSTAASSGGASASRLRAQRQARHAQQLARDLRAELLQQREALAHQLRLGDLLRVARAVQRRDHAPRLIVDGHRDRDDAVRQLVLHRGVAGAPALLDQLHQLRRIGHRVTGQRGELRASSKYFCSRSALSPASSTRPIEVG